MTISELLIPPSPVDWRLWDHEVMMGWKTSEEIQQACRQELLAINAQLMSTRPEFASFTHARKYLGLSKIPKLVETLSEELKADRHKKVVLFFETRDVGMALRSMLKAVKPILLFKGTPDAQRAKRLKDFATKGWCRVAVVDVKAAPAIDHLTVECVYVELTADAPTNAAAYHATTTMVRPRLVLLAGTVDEALMRQRWQATAAVLEGVPA